MYFSTTFLLSYIEKTRENIKKRKKLSREMARTPVILANDARDSICWMSHEQIQRLTEVFPPGTHAKDVEMGRERCENDHLDGSALWIGVKNDPAAALHVA